MIESARYILQILVFLALILSVGTVGYLLIEDGISGSDAFYMAVTAITPPQFHEVHQLSVAGRYFTVILVFCGFGAVVAFATQFARLIIQSELEGVGAITRRQMQRRIRRMKNHYIICGFGEIGGAICSELKDQQLPFVVIANDEDSIAAVNREGYPLVRGNPTADASLKEAAVERAIGVITVLADAADNLFISLAVRELNPKIFIIARGEDASVEERILRAGADIVVSPMKLGGRQIAALIRQQANLAPTTDTATTASDVLGLGLCLYRHEAIVPVSLLDILQANKAINAPGIYRAAGGFDSSPKNNTLVKRDDTVVLVRRTCETGHAFQHRATGKSVLIADDHRALRLLYARKLASAGHEVIQAASGDEAVQLAIEHHPNVIVLDCDMPGRTGYEVTRQLRKRDDFADTPIVLYSGNQSESFIDRGIESGATHCLRKSSSSSELLETIEAAFHSRNGAAQNAPDAEDPADAASEFDYSIAMQNAEGDADLVAELVEAVRDDTPKIMQRLQQAVEQNDLESVRRETHMLKSSVAIVGAEESSRLAGEILLPLQLAMTKAFSFAQSMKPAD